MPKGDEKNDGFTMQRQFLRKQQPGFLLQTGH